MPKVDDFVVRRTSAGRREPVNVICFDAVRADATASPS